MSQITVNDRLLVVLGRSRDNRTAPFRVLGSGKSLRIECRLPGADCNVYLAFAAALASGLDGIQNRIEPPPPLEGNIYFAKNLLTVPQSLVRTFSISCSYQWRGMAACHYYVSGWWSSRWSPAMKIVNTKWLSTGRGHRHFQEQRICKGNVRRGCPPPLRSLLWNRTTRISASSHWLGKGTILWANIMEVFSLGRSNSLCRCITFCVKCYGWDVNPGPSSTRLCWAGAKREQPLYPPMNESWVQLTSRKFV